MKSLRPPVVGVLTLGSLVGLVLGAFTVPDGWWALSWIGYVLVGAVILLRRPDNPIGWLLLFIGVAWAVNMMLFRVIEHFPPSVWLEMSSHILGYIAWLLLVFIPVVFPWGRPGDAFTRFLRTALVATAVAVIAAELVSPAPKELTGQVSPLAIPALDAVADFMLDEGFIAVPLLLTLSLGSIGPRWRRATGVERLQYSWLVTGLIFAVVGLTISEFIGDESFQVFALVFTLSLNLIPLAIGVAILRYRLYEIDRIVSRTVTYGLVIGLLVGIYVASVTMVSQVLPAESDMAVAASTLAVAALFNPLRTRLQSLVERRFNRSRYNAQRVIDDFTTNLHHRTSHLRDELTGVVATTLQPARLGVWLQEGDRGDIMDPSPP